LKKGVGSKSVDPLARGTDPGIRIRISTKMLRIPNTGVTLNIKIISFGTDSLQFLKNPDLIK
jgi:hypothetical protein